MLLLEPRSTVNTGDVDNERTVRNLDRLDAGRACAAPNRGRRRRPDERG